MNRRWSAQVLTELADVRSLQEKQAEQARRRAQAVVTAARTERARRAAELRAAQDAWLASVSGATFSIASAAGWSRVVAERVQGLGEGDMTVRSAEADARVAAKTWAEAVARLEVADDMATAARRDVRRHEEEAELAEVADRASRLVVAS